jgi:hypothetical protein
VVNDGETLHFGGGSTKAIKSTYLVVDIAILGLHDMDGAHLGVSHPLDILGLVGLVLWVIVLGVFKVQVVDQETLLLCWGQLCQRRIGGSSLLGLVI